MPTRLLHCYVTIACSISSIILSGLVFKTHRDWIRAGDFSSFVQILNLTLLMLSMMQIAVLLFVGSWVVMKHFHEQPEEEPGVSLFMEEVTSAFVIGGSGIAAVMAIILGMRFISS